MRIICYFPSKMASQFVALLVICCLQCLVSVSFGSNSSTKLYIVYMGEKQYEDPKLVTRLHHNMLTTLLGSKEKALGSIVYSYKHGFSGFAAMLTESQSYKLADLPEVISVNPSRNYNLHTTRSWDFLGLGYNNPTGLPKTANYGDGSIIGIIDSGIWPESRSFSDEGYGPIPSRWKGTCQVGQFFGASNCSKKIIGARWYSKGVNPEFLEGEFLSARDTAGHGTHTASTAAGSLVKNVSFNGLGAGLARGGAPRARLAIYKACWSGSVTCPSAAVLAAIDDAIYDGVDILSLSLGGPEEIPGTLHAVSKGITVVFSAGNRGPASQTIQHGVPWVITVAATSIDRSFPTMITLGDGKQLVGQSIYYESRKDERFNELVDGASCDRSSLNSTNIAGKMVLCYSPATGATSLPRYDLQAAINNVLQSGGKGLMYATSMSNLLSIVTSCGETPCILIDFQNARQILKYLRTVRKNIVKIEPTITVVGEQVLSPKLASFSSRGPSASYPGAVKPDIAAPGHMILAAVGDSYEFMSGTSMACPHVSAVAALLKSVHPDWSPATIRSALITTASVTDAYGLPIRAEGNPRKIADPFDFGGGNINANKAIDPGLVYDIDPKDYFKFFSCSVDGRYERCSNSTEPLYHLNLPSISIPDLRGNLTIWRTVINVGTAAKASYRADVKPPPGIQMVVEPSVLEFDANRTKNTFKITFSPIHILQGDFTFGSLTWQESGIHSVRIPIAVRVEVQDLYSVIS